MEALRYTIGSTLRLPLDHHLDLTADGFAYQQSSWCYGHNQQSACLTYSVLPIVISLGGTGIFNLFPIAYAFLPELRDRLTQGRRALPWKPWVFGEGDSHPFYRVLMPCIITSMRSSAPYGTPSALHTTLSYRSDSAAASSEPVISALCFSPVYFRRKVSRLVSCYALFKWWLPLSQHPNCFRNFTSLHT